VLYNRAAADPEGKPWSERKAYVWWDEDAGRWTGHDVPDFDVTKRPDYRPADDARGLGRDRR
jgi:formate dehydrogenase major subunit